MAILYLNQPTEVGETFVFGQGMDGVYGAWKARTLSILNSGYWAKVEDLGPVVPGGVHRRFVVDAANRLGLPLRWGRRA